MPDLPTRIRRYRKAAGLSQIALARALGISGPSVNEWESGKSRPSIERLPDLAQILGCDVADLVENRPDPLAAERAALMAATRDADRATLVLLAEIATRMVASQPKRTTDT
jgi:transcriptional regulator with XRE-family HTH domain